MEGQTCVAASCSSSRGEAGEAAGEAAPAPLDTSSVHSSSPAALPSTFLSSLLRPTRRSTLKKILFPTSFSYFAQLRDDKREETLYESSQREVLLVSGFLIFFLNLYRYFIIKYYFNKKSLHQIVKCYFIIYCVLNKCLAQNLHRAETN